MPKFLLPAVITFIGMPCLAAQAAPASRPADPCTVSGATGGDIRVVTCTVAAGGTYRLSFRFRGGHDDTSASLSASLDGRPFDCGVGSKTTLFAEDGDIELHCRAEVAGDVGTDRSLMVTVLWSHAQYRDFSFSSE